MDWSLSATDFFEVTISFVPEAVINSVMPME